MHLHLEYLFQTYQREESGKVHLYDRNFVKKNIVKKT